MLNTSIHHPGKLTPIALSNKYQTRASEMAIKIDSNSMNSYLQQINASLQSMPVSFSSLITQLMRSCSIETSSPKDTTLINRTGRRATCSPQETLSNINNSSTSSTIRINSNTIIKDSHNISKRQQVINRFITCARRPKSTCLRIIGSPRAIPLTHRPSNESSTQSTISTSLGAPRAGQ